MSTTRSTANAVAGYHSWQSRNISKRSKPDDYRQA